VLSWKTSVVLNVFLFDQMGSLSGRTVVFSGVKMQPGRQELIASFDEQALITWVAWIPAKLT